MTIRTLVTVCFSMSCFILRGQFDSLPLPVERLSEDDILSLKTNGKQTLVLSATRTPTELDDQPFTMKVFTSEDILNNGWITLCDLLRHAPGIRVSQPGNGLDGDTFLMRGLPGNSHVRIMINDIPVKPSVTEGMPLGAQLPIRQAERIEILYGPAAAAIYGDEATAGVINIILKETERPLFTQADLSFGGNGFNSLDLFFGGKFGRDKNIFRFAIYGSSTILNDRDLFHEEDNSILFNAKNYLFPWMDSSWVEIMSNYQEARNVPKFPGDLPSITSKTPHESRLFGFNLRWRGIHFSYDEMVRRDHSSLGLNPRAASFASSQNFVGERIRSFSMGARRDRERRSFSFTAGIERYQMDDRSTWAWILPQFGLEYLDHIDPKHLLSAGELLLPQLHLADNFFNGNRYAYTACADIRYDLRWTRRFKYGWQLDLGHAFTGSFQRLVEQYSFDAARPVGFFQLKTDFSSPVGSDFYVGFLDGRLNLNSQLQWKRPKWHLIASAMGHGGRSFDSFYSLAGSRKVLGWLQFRATASKATRTPSLQYQGNTFRIATNPNQLFPQTRTTNPFDELFSNEKTGNFEFGTRLKIKHFGSVDAAIFSSRTDHFMAYGYAWQAPRDTDFVQETKANFFGWNNNARSTRWATGLQADFRFEPTSSTFRWNKIEKEVVTQNSASFTWTKGKNRAPDSPTIFDFVPNLPAVIFRWQTEISGPKTRLIFRINSQSGAKSHFPFWAEKWKQSGQIPQGVDKFTTLDVVFRRSLSKNFQVYLSMTNLFNRHFAGLDATGTPDDLLFNPQPGRQTRFGINYNMN